MLNQHEWTDDEIRIAKNMRDIGATYSDIGHKLGVSNNAVRAKLGRSQYTPQKINSLVSISPYPIYNSPLEMVGDALVIPDPEFPFHDADFINKVLDIAVSWEITQCIIAGDVLHFDSLSQWEKAWIEPKGGLTEDQIKIFMEYISTLPEKKQQEGIALLNKIDLPVDDSVSTELSIARRELKKLSEIFTEIHYIIGNHCGRLLAALQSPLFPQELLRLLELNNDKKWKIAPYYYSYLKTEKRTYQIEHPKSAAKISAIRLADKYNCSIIQGHSHRLSYDFSTSGEHFAIQAGCCVDENRLPYAAQRHNLSDQHKLGAVIVKNSYPYLLHEETDWDSIRQLF